MRDGHTPTPAPAQRTQGMLASAAASAAPAASPPHPLLPAEDAPPQPPLCTRAARLAFTSRVESDLAALFRRGPEYEQGLELIITLRSTARCAATSGSGAAGAALAPAAAPVVTSTAAAAGATAAAAQAAGATSVSTVTRGAEPADRAGHSAGAAPGGLPTGGAEEEEEEEEARQFLSQLAALAQSSLAGAVQVGGSPCVGCTVASQVLKVQRTLSLPLVLVLQVSWGHEAAVAEAAGGLPFDALWGQPGGGEVGDGVWWGAPLRHPALLQGRRYVVMARFPTRQQLEAFRASPPLVALWQQRVQLEREPASGVPPLLPLCVEQEFVLSPLPSSS